jgi:hypothetical protein
MSRITLSGNASGTGNFTLASPNSNTDRTLTLPDATGTVVLANGSGNIATTSVTPSAGIYLGGSGSANLLDDYEEGTWSPLIRGTGSDPTVTYVSANTGGIYTKVGDMVFMSFEVRWSAISGGSGDVYISGLPFTRNSTSNPDGDRGVLDYFFVTVPSGGIDGFASVAFNTTRVDIGFCRSGASTLSVPVGNLINNNPGYLRASLFYKTT